MTNGDLAVTTAKIVSGSDPGTVWYMGVVPALKARSKGPEGHLDFEKLISQSGPSRERASWIRRLQRLWRPEEQLTSTGVATTMGVEAAGWLVIGVG